MVQRRHDGQRGNGGRGGQAPQIDPRLAAAIDAGVPMIGAKPHEVSLLVKTSDDKPAAVCELGLCIAKLLLQIANIPVAIDAIKGGREPLAAIAGDAQATAEVLGVLESARQMISDSASRLAQRREDAKKRAESNGKPAPELIAPAAVPVAVDDGPAPVTEGS